jgi:hypothetical protein
MPAPTIDAYTAALSPPLRDVATTLRTLLDREIGANLGTVWHGHPVWKDGTRPVAGFKAYSAHITFMIWAGTTVTDSTKRLQLSSSGMGSIKLRAPADVDATTFAGWLRQACGARETGPAS